MTITRLSPDTIIRLSEAASAADMRGSSMRIVTGEFMNYLSGSLEPGIKWDNGSGWTPAYF